MQRLDLFTVPLSGINLIEASAGTGKTHTITGLYLRLVIEAGFAVNQILVVTYTRAATEELRDRIRRRLVQMREVFLHGGGDDFCQALLAHCEQRRLDREIVIRRLTNGIRGFDEAAIFTIHGFCQRVLADSAFESGMPFATELLPDQREILQEIVEDFWRQEFYEASPLLVNYLLDEGHSPESLAKQIAPYLGKPYLKVLGPGRPPDFSNAEQAFARNYDQVRQLWLGEQQQIADLLSNHTGLNATKYPKRSLPGWLALLGDYLLAEQPNLKLFKQFEKFTARHLVESVKRGQTPPTHDFFQACDELQEAYDDLAECYRQYLLERRTRLLAFCNSELENRKRRRQVQFYDDLLINLYRGLTGEGGEELAQTLRKRYPAALVDEFQDTDPVQYTIFRCLYAGTGLPVFLVGDPKQAIYSFRGADIFAYLMARREAIQHYTLEVNWRSDPKLIQALNALLGKVSQPFLFADIPFQAVVAAYTLGGSLAIEGQTDAPPLRLWFLGDSDKPLAKGQANERAAHATAAEIARLLNLGARGEVRLGEYALQGGDIAVLVRNHRQARLIREQLLRLGVPSVQQAQDNVFASREALELEWLLLAVAEPGREPRVRAALATEILGLNGEDLYRLSEDEATWEERLEAFQDYHRLWRERGFIRMFRQLLSAEKVYQRLLSFRDGERRLTNLLHLGELLQARASRLHTSMQGLLKWLSQQRASQAIEEEAHQLRLESDEHLVKIVTVHKSKGLEYPVVFCPFLWDGRLWAEKSDTFSFHDPTDPTSTLLELGSELQEQYRPWARFEEAAENLRLLYVALTRAKHRCYLTWGHISQAETSALAWLLHQHPVPGNSLVNQGEAEEKYAWLTATAERVRAMQGKALVRELEQLVASAPEAIHLEPLPEEPGLPYRPSLQQEPSPVVNNCLHPIGDRWQISSFTALTVGQGAEVPDYDMVSALAREEVMPAEALTIFNFPRGVRAGACLHTIFERLDFTQRDHQRLVSLVERKLAEYGFAAEWTPVVAAMVERVLATPLEQGGPLLQTVSLDRRINELEFYYPLAGLTPVGLRRVLMAQGYAVESLHEEVEKLRFKFTRGYMKGFIDLVFEADGRFYLVDYKSNWLGVELTAYHAESLARIMAQESYYLQYLIYSVALHRYLGLRLPDYDYERHFGAVYYLFLRGMDPHLGSAYGVYRDRPSRALVAALDTYFATGRLA
jgi:exodeoxyribonuclease V beta subunit